MNDEIMKVLEAAGRRIADLEIEVDCKNFEIENLKIQLKAYIPGRMVPEKTEESK